MRALAIPLVTLLAGMGHATGQGLHGATGTRSFIWPNGDSFIGEFRNGLPNGTGTMRYANGQAFSGEWVDGCLQIGTHRLAAFTPLKSCARRSPVPLPQLADR